MPTNTNSTAMLDSLATQTVAQISTPHFILNVLLTIFLSAILSWCFSRFSNSFTGKKIFSRNFVLIAVTTMMIISIIKASLALSLGLVGALSIVRFRTAIKDPEELAYLFLTIAIGLGIGADQVKVTIITFVIIVIVLFVREKLAKKDQVSNMGLTVLAPTANSPLSLDRLLAILEKYCSLVNLRRMDSSEREQEYAFNIDLKEARNLELVRSEIVKLDTKARVLFIDSNNG